MEKQNLLDGWKKLLVTAGGAVPLGFGAVPENLTWPHVVLFSVALVSFAIQDAAKAWRSK